jgi:hypothetical protein
MNLASIAAQELERTTETFYKLDSTSALLVRSFWRPFSISNPADRVFFVERTFMCLVRARRLEWSVPRVETLG